MRLLNVKDFTFLDCYGDAIPRYAILSHRWREDELSYQDFLARRKRDGAGWRKIEQACKLVASDGQKYDASSWIWIDTCCINKESSAELSEAVNSMFQWYRDAAVCYAYLDDVSDRPLGYVTESDALEPHMRYASLVPAIGSATVAETFEKDFKNSEWFTRGWTLQELLAPQNVQFLARSWASIGDKSSFRHEISHTTGIDVEFLRSRPLSWACAATKLSWAANRHTSRVEDLAYCLLGIMKINIPLLYGEGEKAFLRLQQEIIRAGEDDSILAWSLSPNNKEISCGGRDMYLFADSHLRFASCGDIQRLAPSDKEPSQLTTRGLRMHRTLIPRPNVRAEFFVLLNCCNYPSLESAFLPLALEVLQVSRDTYVRRRCVPLPQSEYPQLLYVPGWTRPKWYTLDAVRQLGLSRTRQPQIFFIRTTPDG